MIRQLFTLPLLFLSVGLFAQAGVGIELQDGKLFPQVSNILPGSPAEKAGIPLNGVVMRINGKEAFLLKAKDAKKLLSGAPGSVLNIVVTGIYRTDTFNLTRVADGKGVSVDPEEIWCNQLAAIFTQLQKDAEKLKGSAVHDGLWLATKKMPETRQCYFETDTTRQAVEPVYRAVLARTTDPDSLEAVFITYKHRLDACLLGWRSTMKEDETYQVNFNNITWKKGNTIVHLQYNPRNTDEATPAYSLDLKVVSVR